MAGVVQNIPFIPWDALQIQKKFDTVHSSDVSLANWGDKVVVVKIARNFSKDLIEKEISILFKCRESPHIVKLLGKTWHDFSQGFVMEYMAQESLDKILSNLSIPLSWSLRKLFALQACKGLAYLHFNRIVHGDVKSGNLLVDEDFKVKWSDFEFSEVKYVRPPFGTPGTKRGETTRGSPEWLPPERMRGRFTDCTESCDVYSFGVVLLEIAARKPPYFDVDDLNILECRIIDNLPDPIPVDCPPEFADVINCSRAYEVKDRLPADELVKKLEIAISQSPC